MNARLPEFVTSSTKEIHSRFELFRTQLCLTASGFLRVTLWCTFQVHCWCVHRASSFSHVTVLKSLARITLQDGETFPANPGVPRSHIYCAADLGTQWSPVTMGWHGDYPLRCTSTAQHRSPGFVWG